MPCPLPLVYTIFAWLGDYGGAFSAEEDCSGASKDAIGHSHQARGVARTIACTLHVAYTIESMLVRTCLACRSSRNKWGGWKAEEMGAREGNPSLF